jgi:hypothetical protein
MISLITTFNRIILVLLTSFFSAFIVKADPLPINLVEKCNTIFNEQNFSRDEIVSMQLWMSHHFGKYPSQFSMRYKNAMAVSGNPSNTGTDVVSFGSGPDIFTPLINYPLAVRIHLVDLFTGWGKGSGQVLSELIQRLKATHPTAEVSIESMGFLKYTPNDFQKFIKKSLETSLRGYSNLTKDKFYSFNFLQSSYELQNLLINNGPSEPIIFNLKWQDENSHLFIKKVYAHIMDFNDSADLRYLDSKLENNLFGGIIVEGSAFPNQIEYYIQKLSLHGFAILETYSDSNFQIKVIQNFQNDKKFQVKLIHRETYMRYGNSTPIEQNLYTVERISL